MWPKGADPPDKTLTGHTPQFGPDRPCASVRGARGPPFGLCSSPVLGYARGRASPAVPSASIVRSRTCCTNPAVTAAAAGHAVLSLRRASPAHRRRRTGLAIELVRRRACATTSPPLCARRPHRARGSVDPPGHAGRSGAACGRLATGAAQAMSGRSGRAAAESALDVAAVLGHRPAAHEENERREGEALLGMAQPGRVFQRLIDSS